MLASQALRDDSANRAIVLDACIRMANGNKSLFFNEIRKIQKRFPCLHRMAILTPFLRCKDLTIRDFSIEYYCNTSQTKPSSHSKNCECHDLPFTRAELKIILKPEPKLSAYKPSPRKGPLIKSLRYYTCPTICKLIAKNIGTDWEEEDEFANPNEDFKPLSAEQAAEALSCTPQVVTSLIRHHYLKGIKIPTKLDYITTAPWLADFVNTYAFHSEIAMENLKRTERVIPRVPSPKPDVVHKAPTIHLKKHLPQDVRDEIDEKRNTKPIPKPPPAQQWLTGRAAARKLNLRPNDILHLRRLGVLREPQFRLGKFRKEYAYSITDVEDAQIWRKNHMTLEEAASFIGCDKLVIQKRYIETGFIPSIKLSLTLISLENVAKCARHYELYTTVAGITNELAIAQWWFISKFITPGILNPLPQDHPDAIPNQSVIIRSEALRHLEDYYTKRENPIFCVFNQPELNSDVASRTPDKDFADDEEI